MSWAAVGIGAMLGAWLRWGLTIALGQLHAHIQLGTLVANLVGGYLVGIALGFFASYPGLSPEWRLFAITGFLGGLTTFSAMSLDAFVMLAAERPASAALYLAAVIGLSLAAAWAGHSVAARLNR